MCAPCFAETPAEVERAKKDEAYREQYALYQYFHSGSARTALFTSGVQPVEIYLTKEQFKPGPFGSGIGSRYVDVVTRGWILGEFRWELPPFVEYDSVWIKHEGKIWPIALLDLDNEALLFGKWEGLARVHRVPKGYEVLGTSPSRGRYERGVDQEGLKEIMQAIKRLTEESC